MSRHTSARIALAAAAAILTLAGCSPAAPAASDQGPAPSAAMSPSTSTGAGDGGAMPHPLVSSTLDPADAPAQLQFTATTLDGATFDGTSLYGTPTIIWFWASWCPICQGEAPGIVSAINELPDGVQVLGIPGYSDAAGMQKFVNDYGLGDVVQLVDSDGSLWANFSVAEQPAIALIAADGTVTTIPGASGKGGFLAAAETIAP